MVTVNTLYPKVQTSIKIDHSQPLPVRSAAALQRGQILRFSARPALSPKAVLLTAFLTGATAQAVSAPSINWYVPALQPVLVHARAEQSQARPKLVPNLIGKTSAAPVVEEGRPVNATNISIVLKKPNIRLNEAIAENARIIVRLPNPATGKEMDVIIPTTSDNPANPAVSIENFALKQDGHTLTATVDNILLPDGAELILPEGALEITRHYDKAIHRKNRRGGVTLSDQEETTSIPLPELVIPIQPNRSNNPLQAKVSDIEALMSLKPAASKKPGVNPTSEDELLPVIPATKPEEQIRQEFKEALILKGQWSATKRALLQEMFSGKLSDEELQAMFQAEKLKSKWGISLNGKERTVTRLLFDPDATILGRKWQHAEFLISPGTTVDAREAGDILADNIPDLELRAAVAHAYEETYTPDKKRLLRPGRIDGRTFVSTFIGMNDSNQPITLRYGTPHIGGVDRPQVPASTNTDTATGQRIVTINEKLRGSIPVDLLSLIAHEIVHQDSVGNGRFEEGTAKLLENFMSLQQKEKFPAAYVDQELAITPLSQQRGNLLNVTYFNSGSSQFPSPGTEVAPVLIPRIFPGFPDAKLSQMRSLQELALTVFGGSGDSVPDEPTPANFYGNQVLRDITGDQSLDFANFSPESVALFDHGILYRLSKPTKARIEADYGGNKKAAKNHVRSSRLLVEDHLNQLGMTPDRSRIPFEIVDVGA